MVGYLLHTVVRGSSRTAVVSLLVAQTRDETWDPPSSLNEMSKSRNFTERDSRLNTDARLILLDHVTGLGESDPSRPPYWHLTAHAQLPLHNDTADTSNKSGGSFRYMILTHLQPAGRRPRSRVVARMFGPNSSIRLYQHSVPRKLQAVLNLSQTDDYDLGSSSILRHAGRIHFRRLLSQRLLLQSRDAALRQCQ